MKNYFKKSHAHKPKKGKGSYDRESQIFDEIKNSTDLEDYELADSIKRDQDEEQQRD